jgi:6-phosphogluconate dehydrogenase
MTEFMKDYGHEGPFTGCETTKEFVAALETPRKIIVMVKAGKPVDAVIEELTPLLDEGDIIIDAGNSHFPDTVRRTEECARNGIRFMGAHGIEYADIQLIAEAYDLLTHVAGLDAPAIAAADCSGREAGRLEP